MTVLVAEPGRLAYAQAYAAQRLGRPLTAAERRVDLVHADRVLARGKERLRAAIQREVRRVVEERFRGLAARMELTAEMVHTLLWLNNEGRKAAMHELRQMGIRPRGIRTYASPSIPPKVEGLAVRTRSLMGSVQLRVEAETRTELGMAGLVSTALAARLAETIPGALDAASRLVSSGFIGGTGDVFSEHADLFDGFEISAVMDDATCDVCEANDGDTFATLEEAATVMEDGWGPNMDCYGDGRCRCRTLPIGASDAGGLSGTPGDAGGTEPAVAADIGVTPFRGGVDNPIGFYDTERFRLFDADVRAAADRWQVTLDQSARVEGLWVGETEPSVSLRVHDGASNVRAMASDLGKGWDQDGVVLFGGPGTDLLVTFGKIDDRPALLRALKDVGIDGGRFTEDGRLQTMGGGKDFSARIQAIADRFDVHFDAEPGSFQLLEKAAGDYEKGIRGGTPRVAGEPAGAGSRRAPVDVGAPAQPQAVGGVEAPVGPVEPTLADVLAAHPGVDLAVSESDYGITLSMIRVAEEARGQGQARAAMRDLLRYADLKGKALALTPEPVGAGGLSKAQLTRWYKGLGFRRNTGSAKDFRFRETMIREPEGTLVTDAAAQKALALDAEIGAALKDAGFKLEKPDLLAALRRLSDFNPLADESSLSADFVPTYSMEREMPEHGDKFWDWVKDQEIKGEYTLLDSWGVRAFFKSKTGRRFGIEFKNKKMDSVKDWYDVYGRAQEVQNSVVSVFPTGPWTQPLPVVSPIAPPPPPPPPPDTSPTEVQRLVLDHPPPDAQSDVRYLALTTGPRATGLVRMYVGPGGEHRVDLATATGWQPRPLASLTELRDAVAVGFGYATALARRIFR